MLGVAHDRREFGATVKHGEVQVATADVNIPTAIVFLASDRLTGHLTGTIMPIAGGLEDRLLHPDTL